MFYSRVPQRQVLALIRVRRSKLDHRYVSGEDLVSEPQSQGEAAAGGGNREAETVREASLTPQFRLGADVLWSGSAWYPGSASLHRGCHG